MRSGMLSPASARADARAAGRQTPDAVDFFSALCIPLCCAGVRAALYGLVSVIKNGPLTAAETAAVTLFCASLMFAVALTPTAALTERLYKRLGFECFRARAGCALATASLLIACGTVAAAYAASRYALSYFGLDKTITSVATAAVTAVASLEACAAAETAFIASHALITGRVGTPGRALKLAFDRTRTEALSLLAFSLSYLPKAALVPLTAGLYLAKLIPEKAAATATLAETYLCAAEFATCETRYKRERTKNSKRGADHGTAHGAVPGAQAP
jgi:hypothetical protein